MVATSAWDGLGYDRASVAFVVVLKLASVGRDEYAGTAASYGESVVAEAG